MEIQHAKVNWNLKNLNSVLEKSNTLILGSFNPNNPNENTDFYYGRNTNHFWKSISRNLKLPENHFTKNLQNKIDCMDKYQFFFCDMIDSIELKCDNNVILNQYINEHIYTNYSDIELFRVRPYVFRNNEIFKKVNYNDLIIEVLEQNKISRVIHTLGNSRINKNALANPLNNNLGFNPFVTLISNTCINNQIEFITTSYSPSQVAVNRGGQLYKDNLDNWINKNIIQIIH